MATRLTVAEYSSLFAARPTSSPEWHAACQKIKADHGGVYPDDWFDRVVSQKDEFDFHFTVEDTELYHDGRAVPTPPPFETPLEHLEWSLALIIDAEEVARVAGRTLRHNSRKLLEEQIREERATMEECLRNAHASAPLAPAAAPAAPPAAQAKPVVMTTNSPDPRKTGLAVEIFAELRGINPLSFDGEGLWVGLNNKNVSFAGDRLSPAEPLLVMLNDREWRESIGTFEELKFLPPRGMRVDEGYTKEVHDVLTTGALVVRYWGLEHADHEEDKPLDPRAQMLSKALTGTTWQWPCQYVYAQLQRARSEEEDEAPRPLAAAAKTTAKAQAQTLKASKEPTYGLTRGFLDAEAAKPPSRKEAQAIARDARASRDEETVAISAGEEAPAAPPSPVPNEPDVPGSPEPGKRFFPSAEYVYPDGTVRKTKSGWFTSEELLRMSMEEQDRWAEACAPPDVLNTFGTPPALSREDLTKYDSPPSSLPSSPKPRRAPPPSPDQREDGFALPASLVDGLAAASVDDDAQ